MPTFPAVLLPLLLSLSASLAEGPPNPAVRAGLPFATIRDAGHMVPRYKPKQALLGSVAVSGQRIRLSCAHTGSACKCAYRKMQRWSNSWSD